MKSSNINISWLTQLSFAVSVLLISSKQSGVRFLYPFINTQNNKNNLISLCCIDFIIKKIKLIDINLMVSFFSNLYNFYLYSSFKLQGLSQQAINQILHSNSHNFFINNYNYSFSHENFYNQHSYQISNNLPDNLLLNQERQGNQPIFRQDVQKNEKVEPFLNQKAQKFNQNQKNNIIKIQSPFSNEYSQIQEQNLKIKVKLRNNLKKASAKQKRQKQKLRNMGQNSQRNVVPNQIHQTLSSLFKKARSSKFVIKLLDIQVNNGKCVKNASVCRFYLYYTILKPKISHYANQKCLALLTQLFDPKCQLYSLQLQQLYRTIGLKVVRNFLYSQGVCQILNSQRIKRQNKFNHLAAIRFLQQNISLIRFTNLHQ